MFTLKPLVHRGEEQIAIYFKKELYSEDLKQRLKALDCVYSNTHKCWYHERKANALKKLFEGLINFGRLDYSALQHTVPSRPTKPELPRSYFSGELPELHKNDFEHYCHLLDARGYAKTTKNTYKSMLKVFLNFFGDRAVRDISNEDVNAFFSQCLVAQDYSVSYQRQMVGALKLFFKKRHGRDLSVEQIEYPRKTRPLPKVLSQGEVAAIIRHLPNLKHRSMISLQYACGLRVNELLNLRMRDIDLSSGVLYLRNSKGNKDRRARLGSGALQEIKRYVMAYEPNDYLFEGQNGGAYSSSSVNAVLQRAAEAAGIERQVTSHMLRHSFATHLMNKGVDLRLIQELLGHKSSRTTEIYTHVSTQLIESVPSPFDSLNLDDDDAKK